METSQNLNSNNSAGKELKGFPIDPVDPIVRYLEGFIKTLFEERPDWAMFLMKIIGTLIISIVSVSSLFVDGNLMTPSESDIIKFISCVIIFSLIDAYSAGLVQMGCEDSINK